MTELQQLNELIEYGKRADAVALVEVLIEKGVPPVEIVEAGLVPGMAAIGDRFKRNEAFVPEMLIAARAMKESMAVLEPLLVRDGVKPAFTAVIGTVQGDLHDIGKNLVAMMWKGANIGVVDLGSNVPPEKFVAAIKEHQPELVGLSALLTTTMPSMKTTIDAIRSEGLACKVIIGGAPITKEFADEIGADGFAPDAASAVDVARELVSK